MAPFAELSAQEGPKAERLSPRREADLSGDIEPYPRATAVNAPPQRGRTSDQTPLTRPRLHLVRPEQLAAQSDEAPAKPVEAIPVAQPAPIRSAPAPSPLVEAIPPPAPAVRTVWAPPPPAPAILERAPDGGPDAPSSPPDPPALRPSAGPSGDLTATTPEQEARARERLTAGPPQELLQAISELYERVTHTTGARMDLAERAMDLLRANGA